jgi:alkylhydroperoxidase family enzyme
MGITNTISRAELAAIAAAVIHGCSHIATSVVHLTLDGVNGK